MTEITFYLSESGEILGFRSEGHAGYAECGKDIFCAAISALVTNTINSIHALTDDELDVDANPEEAYIDAYFFGATSEKAQLLMESLRMGLTDIADEDENEEFIKLIYEEVT